MTYSIPNPQSPTPAPKTCLNGFCRKPIDPRRGGSRCNACDAYYRRTRTERPRALVDRTK